MQRHSVAAGKRIYSDLQSRLQLLDCEVKYLQILLRLLCEDSPNESIMPLVQKRPFPSSYPSIDISFFHNRKWYSPVEGWIKYHQGLPIHEKKEIDGHWHFLTVLATVIKSKLVWVCRGNVELFPLHSVKTLLGRAVPEMLQNHSSREPWDKSSGQFGVFEKVREISPLLPFSQRYTVTISKTGNHRNSCHFTFHLPCVHF